MSIVRKVRLAVALAWSSLPGSDAVAVIGEGVVGAG
jgi:hypothetical protein